MPPRSASTDSSKSAGQGGGPQKKAKTAQIPPKTTSGQTQQGRQASEKPEAGPSQQTIAPNDESPPTMAEAEARLLNLKIDYIDLKFKLYTLGSKCENALERVTWRYNSREKVDSLNRAGYGKLSALEFTNMRLEIAPKDAFDRAVWITTQNSVRLWATDTRNNIIVLNGKEPQNPTRSPVTVWSALLASQRFNPKKCICLSWFHNQAPEGDRLGLSVLSLIVQLYGKGSPDLPALPLVPEEPGDETRPDLNLVDPFLKLLMEQLKQTQVIIIIDCVPGREEYWFCGKLCDRMTGIMKRQQGVGDLHALKLVVTTAGQGSAMGEYSQSTLVDVPSLEEWDTEEGKLAAHVTCAGYYGAPMYRLPD